jgi:intracellular septation protein
MKQFIEFLPIALFVAVYFYTKDIYISTGILMAGVCVQAGYEYGTTRELSKQTLVIFCVVIIFGGATLLFRNQAFIQWKPTIVNWIFSLTLLGSQFVLKQNLLKKMLGTQLTLPDHVWFNLVRGWSLGFFIAGALNLIVAYGFSLDFWVSFKLIGGFATTLIYISITIAYLAKGGYLQDPDNPTDQQ